MYKLVNIKTQKETLCQKIQIENFDYYVSDKETKWAIDENNKLVNLWFYPEKLKGFVLATNNPNIDIPKVVDNVEKLAWDIIINDSSLVEPKEQIIGVTAFYEGYNKSQETHPNSDEDMIEFAEFCSEYDYRLFGSKTYKELLRLWKEQQPKIVLYEN